MYKEDLALNNLQWLICHKTQPNLIKVGQTQVLGIQIPQDNAQDQIVRSGNYSGLSIRVASIDENKNNHQKINMTHTQTTCPNHTALHAGKNGVRPAEIGALALGVMVMLEYPLERFVWLFV